MKKGLFVGCLIISAFFAELASAQQRVQGYTRRDGTYVAPYYRSAPNKSYNDNYGVYGNQNPYTGRGGTGSPTFNDRTPEYNRRHYGNPMYDRSRRY